MKKSSNKEIEALEKRIKDLQYAGGHKQEKTDYLEKMAEIAKTEKDIIRPKKE